MHKNSIIQSVYSYVSFYLFRFSQSNSEINVNLDDSIDFRCPFYPSGTSSSSYKYYLVYIVSIQSPSVHLKNNAKSYLACEKSDSREITLACFQVTMDEYSQCRLDTPVRGTLVINCSEPNTEQYFTILIRRFQSVPGMIDFPPGKYYFMSKNKIF